MLNSSTAQKMEMDSEPIKASAFKDFLALIKIGIVNSNMITAFTGIWLALFYNDLKLFDYMEYVILAVIGTWLVVAGSGSMNNFIDRDIDVVMKRTKKRPTVTGRFSPAFSLTIAVSFITLGSLMLFYTTPAAGFIGLFGSFAYCVLYTIWTKRRYTLNTVVGSFSGAVPPLIGWAAIDGNLHPVAWVLFLIMFIWQIPHFLALAMKKTEDYRAANIPMLPVVYGFAITKRQIMIWILCLLPLPFYLMDLGLPFVILASILNLGWLAMGVNGYKSMDDLKWANRMFIYSLNYLTIMFVSMIIFTLV